MPRALARVLAAVKPLCNMRGACFGRRAMGGVDNLGFAQPVDAPDGWAGRGHSVELVAGVASLEVTWWQKGRAFGLVSSADGLDFAQRVDAPDEGGARQRGWGRACIGVGVGHWDGGGTEGVS